MNHGVRPKRAVRAISRSVVEALEERRLFTAYTVTSNADSGAGTLRQAILASNAAGGSNTISFNLSSGSQTITPLTDLPTVTATVRIDGTTQPGYSSSPVVAIDMSHETVGLSIAANNCVITGLSMYHSQRDLGLAGTGNLVTANWFGLDLSGSTQSSSTDVYVTGAGNTIGGTTASARNVISGAISYGVELFADSLVEGNYIGTNAAGTAAAPNVIGVEFGATVGTIGGSTAGANLISGNSRSAIETLAGSGTGQEGYISYNRIGVAANGSALGNQKYGIWDWDYDGGKSKLSITNNEIANTVQGPGIEIDAASSDLIEKNNFHDNSALAIDYAGDGVTANDASDTNNTTSTNPLNFPVITSLSGTGSSTAVNLTYKGAANRALTVDLYSTPVADASGHGEATTWLGSTSATSDANGVAKFAITTGALANGTILTATTSDLSANLTSEFSADFTANSANGVLNVNVADITGNYALPAGRTVYIDSNNNDILDAGEKTLTTTGSGGDTFGTVTPGIYVLRQVLPAGYMQAYPSGDAVSTVTVTSAGTATALFYTRNVNVLPRLDGVSAVGEGGSLTLDASPSSISTGTIASYAWDFNYDGTFNADATTATTIFNAATIDGPASRRVALRLTDSQGDAIITDAYIQIININPEASFSSGPSVTVGSASTVVFSNTTDPSPADAAAGFKYSYDFNNDGDFDDAGDIALSSSASASYTFDSAGTHFVHGRITDKDGGETDYTAVVSVVSNIPSVPAAPTQPVAKANSATQVTLTWSDNSSNETAFTIQRAADSSFSSPTTFTAAANATSFVDTTVAPSTVYYYRVAATNAVGSSAYNLSPAVATPAAAPTLPAAPSNLTGVANTGTQVTLTWQDNSLNETGFVIQRAQSSGFTSHLVSFAVAANATNYVDNTTSAKTTYYYRIYAMNSGGNSANSATAKLTTPAGGTVTLPTAPTSPVAVADSATQVTVSWADNATNETSYEVQRSTGSTFSTYTSFIAAANAAGYVDTTASASTLYYYRVRAVNSAGSSGFATASPVTTPPTPVPPPTPPSNAVAVANSATQVTLSWKDNASNETGYDIQRSTDSAFSDYSSFSAAPNATSYIDTSVVASTTYYYRVRGFNSGGYSGFATASPVATPSSAGTVLATPTNVKVTKPASGSLLTTWTDNATGETGYEIQIAKSSGFSNIAKDVVVNTPNLQSYLASGLSAGTYYYIRVRAVDASASLDSAWSTSVKLQA